MARAILLLCTLSLMVACGAAKDKRSRRAGRDGLSGPMGRIDEGARCDTKLGREVLVDLNQDDVPDVRKVFKTVNGTEVLICREADLNFDGTKDLFVFYEDSGRIVRDEADLDFDKRIDIISLFDKGKVIKQEIDTNSDGLVDRVRYIQNDLPIRTEGDTDGDGKVDLWEYYIAGRLVRVGMDLDGDGRADSWERDGEAEAAQYEDEETAPAEASDSATPTAGTGTKPDAATDKGKKPPAKAPTGDAGKETKKNKEKDKK
jgi:hypothetical protein